MKILFKNAQLIDPDANTVRWGNLLVRDGIIVDIFYSCHHSNYLDSKDVDSIIECDNFYLAPGIIDVGVKVCEPGERHKESFRSASEAAAAGGITTIVIRSDTHPAIDTPEILNFIRHRALDDSMVRVLPMAALTKGRAGREMAEIKLLQDNGAIAFSDCDSVISDNKVFSRCLYYAAASDALVISHAQDMNLSNGAVATSGALATRLGLPAVSTMAERLQLERDLAIFEMTGGRLHIDQISSAVALPALQRAKNLQLLVTAGVSIHHLTLNELDIVGYPSYFKLKPPLRCEADRQAMIEAVKSELIDIICSMHTPQNEDSKRLPFETAASGAIGLETLLPALMQLVHAKVIDLPCLWRALSLNPAKLLQLDSGRLAPHAPADLVLFDPDRPFILDRTKLRSKSKNTPFDNRHMQGKVLRTFVGGRQIYPEVIYDSNI